MNTIRLFAVLMLSATSLTPAWAYNHHDAMHDAYERAMQRIEARQAERRARQQIQDKQAQERNTQNTTAPTSNLQAYSNTPQR